MTIIILLFVIIQACNRKYNLQLRCIININVVMYNSSIQITKESILISCGGG
jgi:hypothetical protein